LDGLSIWAQFGLAGAIAISLGTVISYIFKLFVKTQSDILKTQSDTVARVIGERNAAQEEIARLHKQIEEQVLPMLGDVSRALAQVQTVFRDRDTALAVQRELERMRGDRESEK
jgi:hypothetical protein